MKKFRLMAAIVASTVLVQPPATAKANEDMFGALIGGMIGAAIANQGSAGSRSTGSSVQSRSSAEIAEARMLQEALNYFGFPAGTPDGVIGRGTRNAISQYQMFMGYSPTGNILPH